MTKVRWRFDQKSGARETLKARYGTDLGSGALIAPGPVDAVSRVTRGIYYEREQTNYTRRPPTDDELLAALALAEDALESAQLGVLHDELSLIEASLERGLTYQQIGIALGHTEPTAERAAKDRHARLRKRFPSYQGHHQKEAEERTGDRTHG